MGADGRPPPGDEGQGPRHVPITSAWAVEALSELQHGKVPTDRLVPSVPNTFTHWVNKAADDCGFPPGRMRRAHTLRSTFASMLADAGTPLPVVQRLMGHANATTTSEFFAISRGADREAVQVFGGAPIEGLLGGAPHA